MSGVVGLGIKGLWVRLDGFDSSAILDSLANLPSLWNALSSLYTLHAIILVRDDFFAAMLAVFVFLGLMANLES
jgi:hypothetical protein